MDRIWLSLYPQGVPAQADLAAFGTLRDLLDDICRRHAGRPALTSLGGTLTYAEFDAQARAFGAWLQHAAGVAKGERVALMLPNVPQYPIALYGALRVGAVVVNVNPVYTARELQHQLADSGATVLVVLENFAQTVQQVLAQTAVRYVVVTALGDPLPPLRRMLTQFVVRHVKKLVPPWQLPAACGWRDALAHGRSHAIAPVPLAANDLAFLQYTGGTTGVAKGAMLSHGNLVANVQQLTAWITRDLVDGHETAVLPLPLYHVFALTAQLLFLRIGARVVLVVNPRDLPDLIATLRAARPTVMIGVNTLFSALLDAPGFDTLDLSTLKVVPAGGMALRRTVAERWQAATGVPLIEGYGLTEASPVVIANPLDITGYTGNIGVPIPSTDAGVLDDAGRALPAGEVGEICVRGPQVMRGYWQRPDETLKVFTADGWLRTGDLGAMDEAGRFRITDRKKDMIVVSGFKVFPNEVEEVVMQHPGVLEVGAVGAPDERSGEVVKIVVVRKDPALTAEALLEHCRARLTGYKMPRVVEFRDTPLPKTNVGKILRRELR